MQSPPMHVRRVLAVFYVATIVAAAFTLLQIWVGIDDETVQRVYASTGVVFAASAFLLAGYRTVYMCTRRDG